MPVVTMLSWNVEHFGPSKTQNIRKGTTNKNGTALFGVIAWTAYYYGANMISLLEVSGSTFRIVANLMVAFLQQTSWSQSEGQNVDSWNYLFAASNKGDIYLLFYKEGQGFAPLLENGPNGPFSSPVCGITNLDVNGAPLDFQGSKTTQGGRMPGYFAFLTTDRPGDNNFAFTIMAFHGMFNSQEANAIGLENITLTFPTSFVHQAIAGQAVPNTVTIHFALLAGDYNVNILEYDDFYDDSIQNLLNGEIAIPESKGDYAKSTLKFTTHDGYPSTLDYRSSAYDNILIKHTPNSEMRNNEIIDMLDLIKIGRPLSGTMAVLTIAYVNNGGMIANNPPVENEDAWHIYRETISNHLPVTASFNF